MGPTYIKYQVSACWFPVKWPPDHAGAGRERERVKAPATNLDWRSLRSPPTVLQTPLSEKGRGKGAETQSHNDRTKPEVQNL